jgi:hypothetical protein
MRLNRTDAIATTAVGLAVFAYLLWLADIGVPGLGSTRVVGAVVLGLGWFASAVAVVPNFDALIHASKVYLGIASALGVTALAAGVVVLVDASTFMLALLVSSTVVMWAMATVRHTRVNTQVAQAQPVPDSERTPPRQLGVGARR